MLHLNGVNSVLHVAPQKEIQLYHVGDMKANPLDHLLLSSSLEILHSEHAACLATSGVELHLFEKRHLSAGVPAEERCRPAACPGMSYL
jgi:hypothetical protein